MDKISEDLQSWIDCKGKEQNYKNLLDAIKLGNEERAISLLKSGVSTVSDDPEVTVEESPIHLACQKGLVNFVKAVKNVEVLLTSQAVYAEWKQVTPFYVAMVAYHEQITSPNEGGEVEVPDMKLTNVITYILDIGADPDIPISTSEKTFKHGMHITTYGISSALHIACTKMSNLAMVTSLVFHGSDVNKTNERGYTPLMTALNTIDQTRNIGEYLEILEKLLKAGADPNAIPANSESRSYTPLRRSLYMDTRVVALLLKYGANVNLTDKQGNMSIMYWMAWFNLEVQNQQIERLQLVMDPSYHINIHTMRNKENFFHIMCSGPIDNPDIVSVMLQKQPGLCMYINEPNSKNVVPLTWAVESCNLQLAVALVRHGALPHVLDEYNGKTIIERAVAELDCTTSWLHQANSHASQALNYLPEFVETMFNMGVMSDVYYFIAWEDSRCDVYYHHKHPSYLSGLFEILSLVITEDESQFEITPEEALVRTKITLALFHSDDLLLHRRPRYKQETDEFDSIVKTLKCDDIYIEELQDYISTLTEIHEERVPSLKRLCRMEIRVNISTKYGMTTDSHFDLRDLCVGLPIPEVLQQYIMVNVPCYALDI